MLFVFIPKSVLEGTVFWKCANVLYLWGTLTLFVSIYPVICYTFNRNIKATDYIIALICIPYTASFEQAGAMLCGTLLCLMMYCLFMNHRLSWKCVCLLLYSLVLTFFFCTLLGEYGKS